jgi:hypothetical protein
VLENRAKQSPDFLGKRAASCCSSSIKNKKEIKKL